MPVLRSLAYLPNSALFHKNNALVSELARLQKKVVCGQGPAMNCLTKISPQFFGLY